MEARLHVRRRLVSILQSIGAAGLGTLGTSISSSFGAAIGTLIGAIGGPKACNIFKRNQIFGRFVKMFIKIIVLIYSYLCQLYYIMIQC
jgi:Na+/phosphate symporter